MSQATLDIIPFYVNIVFILTTLLTVFLLYRATQNSILTLALIIGWLIIQAFISSSDFYAKTDTFPPRFVLATLPALLLLVLTFLTKSGRSFIDSLDMRKLTFLHIIRIPVELVLFWLFLYGKIPGLMTFEGRNFDILSGISAPFIAYYCFKGNINRKKLLLAWNFICLALLLNIVVNAALSAPFTFQQFAYEQPNVAVLFFPYVWLPCCIVPIVLFSHLAVIKRIISDENN